MSADPRRSAPQSKADQRQTRIRALLAVTLGLEQALRPLRIRARRVPVPGLSAAALQELTEVTTQTELTDAPRDDSHDQRGTGHIVVPRVPLAIFDAAGGRPIARLRPVWAGSEAWLPVIEWQPGWVRVLLPTRQNGATGWLDASRVTTARSRYSIYLSLRTSMLSLLCGEQLVGAWPADLHAEHHTIAAGRTFVLASVRRGLATPPMLLRLAVHLHDRDGGLLTIHPRSSPAGAAAAGGGISVSDEVMAALHVVPPGCLVHLGAR